MKPHTHDTGCNHDHGGIFGKNTELIFSLLCGVFLLTGFLTDKLYEGNNFPLYLYITAYFFGGYFATKEAWEKIREGGFEIDFLMIVAAIGAAVLGKWTEGALLLLLFSLGHALEHYAMNKARNSIKALGNLSPKTALIKRNGTTEDIPVENLQLGDIILIKPGSKIAADGIIVRGQSSINQAPITGESIPVDKHAAAEANEITDFASVPDEHKAFTGTINGNSSLEVKVLKLSEDSTLSRLVALVSQAEAKQSPTQQFTKKFERIFVPAVIVLVIALCFAYLIIDEPFSVSFYRAMTVLVAASPCALAISTPSAVLSGVARAAQAGVLIKGGKALENLGSLSAIAFDKTGTLTKGEPRLTNIVPLNGTSKEEFLDCVLAVERLSDHPLAKAITKDILKMPGNTPPNGTPEATDLEALQGKGVKARYSEETVYIGNPALFEEDLGDSLPDSIRNTISGFQEEGHTTMLVKKGDIFLGILTLMDTPREAARSTLEALRNTGIRKMVMLTGDHQKVADSIARQTGLTDAYGDLLPEDKVNAIRKLRQQEKQIAMVGDGVNDAPAMANSTVGIAMGAAGSDVALETADIALMDDKLEKLPFVIGLSRRSRNIIRQNLWISLGIVLFLIPSAIIGFTGIGPTVAIHEGSTLIVVFNALRLLAYKR
ncbi:heavy metal translocating P-type ATPase [Sinomicrobium weinanense]|uniref:Heavy metal translocating P-type ATPase n=1 Tax=Sinomicrobium weinanense TaxID=2842200 RepID=A0A926JNI9_9FLAO|nr:heavy metal translocating P-type ATPase [Sinomicrobium weinanense]MBC9794418.1 heavy metal translocating P-type ATPase [Sinomicrobium weinanense]MBU3124325.1 heavy metal translocating P-type ATPase [Sinomicrobium weinanense]